MAQAGENGLVRVAILGPFEVHGDAGDRLPVAGARLRDAPYALRLDGLRLEATLTWLEREIAAGRAAAHVAGLEALAAERPLNEKITTLLMRTLAATGRQAEALAVYETLRGRLADELGLDPGRDLRAVHLEVLRGEVKAASVPLRVAKRLGQPGGLNR